MTTDQNLTHEKLAEVLNQYYIPEHGVINVRGALDELHRAYKQPDIEQSFLDFYAHSNLYDAKMPQRAWVPTFYGLAAFAVTGELSDKGADCLTSIALREGSRNLDYLNRGISALKDEKYIDNLRRILDECIQGNVHDSTWIGFHIVSSVLTHGLEFEVFDRYVNVLRPRIQEEPDELRRVQMIEILERIESSKHG